MEGFGGRSGGSVLLECRFPRRGGHDLQARSAKVHYNPTFVGVSRSDDGRAKDLCTVHGRRLLDRCRIDRGGAREEGFAYAEAIPGYWLTDVAQSSSLHKEVTTVFSGKVVVDSLTSLEI